MKKTENKTSVEYDDTKSERKETITEYDKILSRYYHTSTIFTAYLLRGCYQSKFSAQQPHSPLHISQF